MDNLFTHLVRVSLALAFLAAGAVKLARPGAFAVIVGAFGVLPEAAVGPLSVALPCLELVAGVLLLLNRGGGLALTGGLLVLFVAVLLYALKMGLDVDCGCYGPSDPELEAFGSIRRALWRDGAMLAGVAFLCWRRMRTLRPGLSSPKRAIPT
ncbi:MauE/DoxX family redox-associated membrane protein [Fundidesulfovibrio terrae]|uniref:MauE/DoxX family redox-associated membrane protein n=1 Tax=Fundidesulfovibrio terrae TaxID=2922866 RepID=UPI001FB03A1B|nr:MauE/DoxX family redox-associated membrane protein [Fundidesulfovibrio terrae]